MSLSDPFPYLRFIRVPPQLEKRIRDASLRLGLVSISAAVIFTGVLVALAGELTFVVYTGGACVLGLLVSGVGLVGGRTCVSEGYVNLTLARQIRNLAVAFMVFTSVFAVVSGFGILMAATAIAEPVPLLVVAGSVITTTTLLTVINAIGGCQLFPPSDKVLREYGISGRIVGPPSGYWGPSGAGPPR